MVCPVCESPAANLFAASNDRQAVNCPQCGSYSITYEARANAKRLFDRWKVSAWIREHLQQGTLDTRNLDLAEHSQVPGLKHRAARFTKALHDQFPTGYEFSSAKAYEMVAITWSRNGGEVRYLLEAVVRDELQYVEERSSGAYRITAKGLLFLEGFGPSESVAGFCAMWFGKEVTALWPEVIEKAIGSAGYQPVRIDHKEHNDKIDDEIIASIRSSRFVVADFTGNRGGVYYEAGFAHGLGLPVIFMCRQDDELHFDIRQYNCIFWTPDKLDEARTRLENRILATLGQGPLRVG